MVVCHCLATENPTGKIFDYAHQIKDRMKVHGWTKELGE